MRQSGILMHISSLPGPDGVGSLGKEAFEFADFLRSAGMTIWQVLPMGPTGYGESPYQSTSVYAGNPLLISLDRLVEEGFLTIRPGERYEPTDLSQVNYAEARAHKMKLLRAGFFLSEKPLREEIRRFEAENEWVRGFALFTALKQHFGGRKWNEWPDRAASRRDEKALHRYRIELDEEIRFHIWCQYIFDRQWQALKKYCNGLGISLFGDMPIYVAEDSADAWLHPEVFQLNRDGQPKRVAGVPPDYFSEDGQLWGNPLYRWTWLKFHGYHWWVGRMAHMAKMYDIVRVDHFIGFANYYSIPYGAPNARGGKWIIGPGKALFKKLKKELPGLDVVAEDLGEVNDRVRRLIAWTGYPGMRVLQFAFGGDDTNIHLPTVISENTAYYTGTHDNLTVRAWAESASKEELARAEKIVGFETIDEAPWAMVRMVMNSKARIAVAPMQDILGLGGEATMNHPGTVGGNWLWRMAPGAATPELAGKLNALNKEAKRREPKT
ncbi:MAG: 4-alpha-glucanotransferase [Clostridia bacterium]|nr:4-alpha-glucanotransferase [Clostridia bacterium]